MAESLIPEVIPGLVQIRRTAGDDKNTGEKKGAVKNVFPIDAMDLLKSGEFELVENGAVEAARMNANPLRSAALNPNIVVAEVTGIAGQAHIAVDEKERDRLVKESDHGGKEVGVEKLPGADGEAPAARMEPAKAAGSPTGAKSDSERK